MKKTKKPDRTKHKPAVRLTGPKGEVLFEGTDREFKSAAKQARLNSEEVASEKVSVGEAMRRAVEQLGPVTIDAQLAAAQMEELAICYDEIAKRQAAYDAKAEEAKTAKKSLESAENLLLTKVKEYTHSKPLPLFDSKQAEQDREDMLASADVDDVDVDEGDELGL